MVAATGVALPALNDHAWHWEATGIPSLRTRNFTPPGFCGGSLTGKRYTDAQETMEFLCTKGGEGTITVAGYDIGIKQAKALPSSD